MIDNEKMNDFIKYAEDKFYFYIEQNFWSKPNIEEIKNWLRNFDTLPEKYCAAKLLDRFVYYSEKDLIRLMEFGLNEKIIKRHILKAEKFHEFQLKNNDIQDLKKEIINAMYFIPLTVGNLSESSLAMLRFLTVDLGFDENKILDIKDLKTETLSKCNNIVVIDDFIGSGKQITDFWNYTNAILDGNEIPMFTLKDCFPHIEFEYFCLVSTQEGKDNFTLNYEGGLKTNLKITYGEILDSKFKVFSSDSTYFESSEQEFCKNVLQNLCQKKGVNLLGYHGLDYAIAFHHSIPDCSLPLFSTNSKTWNYLFKNKNTKSDEDF